MRVLNLFSPLNSKPNIQNLKAFVQLFLIIFRIKSDFFTQIFYWISKLYKRIHFLTNFNILLFSKLAYDLNFKYIYYS
jgi:hypothetical protein